MCRGKPFCSELGNDQSTWDKDCPLRHPYEYSHAVDMFIDATKLYVSGQRETCIDLLENINEQGITNWYIEHGQMSGFHRYRIIGLELGAPLALENRYPVRSPLKLQNAVFERDGYRCRYCGNRLIDQKILKSFSKALDSPSFIRGTTNLTSHAIIHIAWPVADHVTPWNRGGETTMDNLVASCATCNYGKAEYTVEQIGITNPLVRQPAVDGWDGLKSLAASI